MIPSTQSTSIKTENPIPVIKPTSVSIKIKTETPVVDNSIKLQEGLKIKLIHK